MRTLNAALLTATALGLFGFVSAPGNTASAQISIGVNFGPEPQCPYGYYDTAPYNCAPDGYYGPEWFSGGHFIGAGHWFHGPKNFHGSVNNHFDPQHGYKAPAPAHGPEQPHHAVFQGNESRDGQGHGTPMAHGGHK